MDLTFPPFFPGIDVNTWIDSIDLLQAIFQTFGSPKTGDRLGPPVTVTEKSGTKFKQNFLLSVHSSTVR